MAEFAPDEHIQGGRILRHAGQDRWPDEEDYRAPAEARAATERHQNACAQHDPEHRERRSRRHWPTERSWAAPGLQR